MNLRRLLKRFVISGAILVLGLSLAWGGIVMMIWGRDAYFSPIPHLASYEAQKEWTHQVQDKVASASEIFAPRLYWNWPLRAYRTLLERYPERASQDENVWAGMGDCYLFLAEFPKAVECYERQLYLFKTQYYGQDYPQKREVGVLKTELEEIKWIANIHDQIANAYLGMRQPQKAITEYHKIITDLGPRLQKLQENSQWHQMWNAEDPEKLKTLERFQLVGRAYNRTAWIYANRLKDYSKAVEVYGTIAKQFSSEPLAVSETKTFIADCYIAMGQLEKGKALYRAIIAEYPDPKTGYAWFAKEHLQKVESGDLSNWLVGVW